RPYPAWLCRDGGLGRRPDRRGRDRRHPGRRRHDPRGLPAGGSGPDRRTAAAPDGGPGNRATAHRRRKALTERVVLAYSGGLDTTVAVAWLADARGLEVVAVAADVGQGGDPETLRERALAAGALDAVVVDARDEYVA